VIALLIQVAAALITVVSAIFLRSESSLFAVWHWAFICGIFAASVSYFAGLAKWWLPIQLFFLPALNWTLGFNFSPHWFLLAFVVLLMVYWSTFRTQVPLYLSSEKVWHALVNLLPPVTPDKPISFVDLGCGLGGVLDHLAGVRPDGRYVGVEAAPVPFLWSYLRLRSKKNCKVRWASLWEEDLAGYDVVFAYLSPVPMEQLWLKAKREMRAGSWFISSTFNVPEQIPHQVIKIDDLHHSKLLIWQM
jgi:hypothetical protein